MSGPAAAAPKQTLSADVATGDTLHLVRPADVGSVELRVSNAAKRDATVDVAVSIDDRYTDEPTWTELGRVEVPAGGEAALAIPGRLILTDPDRPFGLRYARWKLTPVTSGNGGDAVQGLTRFAVMDPVGPTKGHDPQDFVFGMAGGSSEWFSDDMHEDMVRAMSEIGVKCMRITFGWRRAQPEPDRWDWSEADRLVDLHEAAGMETQMLIAFGGAPWTKSPETMKQIKAAGEMQAQWRYPPTEEAWRNMVRTIAERYKGRIRLWEVWNEADLGFLRGTTEQYLDLLRWAHEELKSVDPDNVVISTGLAGLNLPNQKKDIYRAILEQPDTWDWYGYHRHGSFDKLWQEVDGKVLPMMQETGTADKPLYFNETALKIDPESEHTQDEVLVKKLAFVWSRGSRGYHWFCPLMPDSFRGKSGWDYHLFYQDRTPRPGVLGMNTAARELRGRKFDQAFEGLGGKRFLMIWKGEGDFIGESDADRVMLLWDQDSFSGDQVYAVRADSIKEAAEVDLAGNVTPLAVRDGQVLMRVERRPKFIRLHGVEGQLEFLEAVLTPQPRVTLAQGQTNEVSVSLRNPYAEAVNVSTRWDVDPRLAVEGPVTADHTLRPGETVDVTLPVRWRQAPGPGVRLDKPTAVFTAAFDGNDNAMSASIPVNPVTDLATDTSANRPADFTLDAKASVVNFNEGDPERQHMLWRGPQDLSAKAWLTYLPDREALELRVLAIDDEHHQQESPFTLWKHDSLQVGLAFPGQSSSWELGVARTEDGKTQNFVWTSPGQSDAGRLRGQLDAEIQPHKDGMLYTVVMPLEALDATPSDLRQGFGFTFLVNDADNADGREGYIRLTEGLGGQSDPKLFELMRLPAASGSASRH